jgi:transcriptional regulator with XRE-family HTH domain
MILRDPKTLAKLMAIEGLSHRGLADAVGWRSHSYVGRLVSGRARTVTPAAAARIAEVLGVEVEDLFAPGRRPSADRTQPSG